MPPAQREPPPFRTGGGQRLPKAFGVGHVEVGSVWEAELRPGGPICFLNPNNPTGAFLTKKELW